MTITFSGDAEDDYATLWRSARDLYPLHTASIQARFQKALEHLDRFPLVAETVDPPVSGYPSLRCFPVPRAGNRVIYYEVDGEIIRIARILHASMDFRAALGD